MPIRETMGDSPYMKNIFLILFIVFTAQLSASTIIINSIYDTDILPGSATAAEAIEDGLMDSLFDFGFIMFSTVNSTTHRVEGAKDARYMISIEPLADNYGVSFQLQATINGMIIDSGIVDLSNINGNSNLEDRKLYYLIGEEIAANLEQFF